MGGQEGRRSHKFSNCSQAFLRGVVVNHLREEVEGGKEPTWLLKQALEMD